MLPYWFKRLTVRHKIVLLGGICCIVLACIHFLPICISTFLSPEKFVPISSSALHNYTIHNGGRVNYAFDPPVTNKFTAGRAFYLSLSEKYIEYVVDSPTRRFPAINADSAARFVFVTAANNKFHHVAMDGVARVQRLFPDYTIYYYDLGQTSKSTVWKIKQLCNVKYRSFNFTQYPEHVKNLYNYAWKPLLIQEVLREHSAVFWFDSSVRFQSADLNSFIAPAVQNGGVMMFDNCGHSIFAATHEGMYRYLPMTRAAAGNLAMRGASAIYIYQTEQIYNAIMRWWVLCALVKDCIGPTTELYCNYEEKSDIYRKCHRYDQSAFNILAAHHFALNDTAYFYTGPVGVLSVERSSYVKELLRVCSDGAVGAPDGRALIGFSLKKWNSI